MAEPVASFANTKKPGLRQPIATAAPKALVNQSLNRPEKISEGIASKAGLISGASLLQTKEETATAGIISGFAESAAFGTMLATKLGLKSQPITPEEPTKKANSPQSAKETASPQPAQEAAPQPAKDVLNFLLAGLTPSTRAPEPDAMKTVFADQRQTGSATSAGSTQIPESDRNAGSQGSEPGKLEADSEAFRIYLRPIVDFTAGSKSSFADQDRQASTTISSLEPLTAGRKDDELMDLSTGAAVGNAFRDGNSLIKQAGTAVEGAAGKNTSTKQDLQAPVARQNPGRFEQDSQSDGRATNGSRYLEILQQTSGQEDVLTPAPTSSENPRVEVIGSTRPVQLPEPIESARLSPTNQMTVRVEGESGQMISVRFLNQGGQVEVAVRSSDPAAASQLRQELTSLTGNLDRIGWRADFTGTPGHETVALHDTSGFDRGSHGSYKGSNFDWEQGPPKKKLSALEFWDELRNGQDP